MVTRTSKHYLRRIVNRLETSARKRAGPIGTGGAKREKNFRVVTFVRIC